MSFEIGKLYEINKSGDVNIYRLDKMDGNKYRFTCFSDDILGFSYTIITVTEDGYYINKNKGSCKLPVTISPVTSINDWDRRVHKLLNPTYPLITECKIMNNGKRIYRTPVFMVGKKSHGGELIIWNDSLTESDELGNIWELNPETNQVRLLVKGNRFKYDSNIKPS